MPLRPESSDSGSQRSSSVERIIEEVCRRRLCGETIDDGAVIDSHPNLMPELAAGLRALRRVEQARLLSQSFASTPVAANPLSGHVDGANSIPGYTLGAEIREGSQGVVYRARQHSTGREVAVKVLRGPGLFPAERIRFEQEARILARLKHPNIIAVHDFVSAHGCLYLVMDLVDGPTLDVWLGESNPPLDAKLATFTRICDAVHAAHLFGVIHRDLKPSNLLIAGNQEPFVVDFGLAKLRSGDLAPEFVGANVTYTGHLIGSVHWLSPEQAESAGDGVDLRADIHALGLILHYLLTGSHAFPRTGSIRAQLETIVHGSPSRPSQFCRGLDHDLDIIVLKCLAKEPSRRYQSAGDLARDVDHYLAQEAIEARRESTLYVLRKFVRRNRLALSAVALTTIFFVAAGLAGAASRSRARESERQFAVAEALGEARRLVQENARLRETYTRLDQELTAFSNQLVAQYFPPEKDQRMFALEKEIRGARSKRTENHHAVLQLLRRAERLDADANQLKQVRGDLYYEQLLAAAGTADPAELAELRRMVQDNDPTGALSAQLNRRGVASIHSNPPGAVVYLFRAVLQSAVVDGGEPRIVPVPAGEPLLPVPPGTLSLRIINGAGDIRIGDVITEVAGHPIRGSLLVEDGNQEIRRLDRLVSVAGTPVEDESVLRSLDSDQNDIPVEFEFDRDGLRYTVTACNLEELSVRVGTPARLAEVGQVPARVWQNGELRSVNLPRGLRVRATAVPMFFCPEAVIGTTPIADHELGIGLYAVVVRTEGFEDWTHYFSLANTVENSGRSNGRIFAVMNPVGTTPPRFRFITTSPYHDHPFWMMESEVTLRDYIEFLNSPETLQRIAEAEVPMLFPRSKENAGDGGYLSRDANGMFTVPATWQHEWPVHSISWNDAKAYAEWRTERAQASGLNHVYSLPTLGHWRSSCVGCWEQKFVFGYHFRPKWVSSCFARPTPGIEPVMSFPVDESIYGVYDISGSMSEWLDDWWIESRGIRRHAGGSWADGGPSDIFGIEGGGGKQPEQCSSSVGFRLILTMPRFNAEPQSLNRQRDLHESWRMTVALR